MNQIALLWNGTPVYWSTLMIMAAALAALLAALGLRLLQGRIADMAVFAPLALLLALIFGRLQHWYCFYRQYTGLAQAFTDFTVGDYCLTGALLGILLAALLLRLLRVIPNLPEFLDALAPAGALGIGIGRFSAAFWSADRGKMIFSSETLHGLPWSDHVTGYWRAAVYCWQGIFALLLTVLLLAVFFYGRLYPEKRRDGAAAELFALLYGGTEIIFDSMRYDSAFFRSNGFVSVVQIVGLVILICALVFHSAVQLRRSGFRPVYILFWIVFLGGAGLMGYMEYYVQRHGDLYVLSYSRMAVGLTACITVILLLRGLRFSAPKRRRRSPAVRSSGGRYQGKRVAHR